MARRITWISAVQEYNKRNNTKVKGKKGTPEYAKIKKLFEELKSGQTQRTAPKEASKKSLKLKSGEKVNLQVECEGGEVKVKEEKKREVKESQEQKEEREFQERKAVRDKQNVEIIDILEKQKDLESKYQDDEYFMLSSPGFSASREKRMKKNRKEFKKLVEKLRAILKEIGMTDNPATMFEKRDYLTYEAFDIEKLPRSSLTFQRELEAEEKKEEKRQKAKEAEEEKEYGILEKKDDPLGLKEGIKREKKAKIKKLKEEAVKEEAEIKELEGKVAEAKKRRIELEKKKKEKKPAESKREAPEKEEVKAPPKCEKGECKKRDIKSKMERLKKRICEADKVDKKDLDFSGEKNNKSINKKFERLKDLLSKDKNKDCEKEAEKKLKEATENKNKALQKPQEKPQESVTLTRYEARFLKKLMRKDPPSIASAIEALEKQLKKIEEGETSKMAIARRLDVQFEQMDKKRDDVIIPKILKKLKSQ